MAAHTLLAPPSSDAAGGTSAFTPETIARLSAELARCITDSGAEIEQINLQTRILSFNAQIEAARAGAAGASFSVVGQEMVEFSRRTGDVSSRLRSESQQLVSELSDISRRLASDVRGTRLADLALTNIDLIDRNLYERSCDCRWWATDGAVVGALAEPSEAAFRHCSERLAVILKAYTVYFDIVLADREGRIVCNGSPARHRSSGMECAQEEWFRSAMATASGDEFGFQSAHASPLAGGERVLIYSCRVCRGGNAGAEPLGVLGVVFRWDALADAIVRKTPVDNGDPAGTRACIVDGSGVLLADSGGRSLTRHREFADCARLFSSPKGFRQTDFEGRRVLMGFARSPGFETYATGWYSVVIQTLRDRSE